MRACVQGSKDGPYGASCCVCVCAGAHAQKAHKKNAYKVMAKAMEGELGYGVGGYGAVGADQIEG